MPWIKYALYPTQDLDRVHSIVRELEAIATAQDVSFYLNAREEGEPEPVVITEGARASIPATVARQLKELAKRAAVTIYVHSRDVG